MKKKLYFKPLIFTGHFAAYRLLQHMKGELIWIGIDWRSTKFEISSALDILTGYMLDKFRNDCFSELYNMTDTSMCRFKK